MGKVKEEREKLESVFLSLFILFILSIPVNS